MNYTVLNPIECINSKKSVLLNSSPRSIKYAFCFRRRVDKCDISNEHVLYSRTTYSTPCVFERRARQTTIATCYLIQPEVARVIYRVVPKHKCIHSAR